MSRRIYSLLQFSIKIYKIANSWTEEIESIHLDKSTSQNETSKKTRVIKSFNCDDRTNIKTKCRNVKDKSYFVSNYEFSTLEN